MKICPTCRRTYADDGLNFCLEDGSVLTFAPADGAPTVVMEHPRTTDPTPSAWQPQNPPAQSMQPKKRSSKAWVWVVGIFAVLILVCGGGFVGFFLYFASGTNSNSVANKGTNNSSTATKANTFTRTTPTPPAPEKGEPKEVDLSGWVEEPTAFLETDFTDGEFLMTSKQKGYYYVLVAKDAEVSDAGVARVTLRNVDDADADMGYGLIFHSDMTPLTNDYAFLIDTKKKKYRVVRHEAQQEKILTGWTSSSFIREGSDLNLLEARDSGEKIELYINGQLANTIVNKQGPKGGVPGLYVGDGAKIGFRKLEVVK